MCVCVCRTSLSAVIGAQLPRPVSTTTHPVFLETSDECVSIIFMGGRMMFGRGGSRRRWWCALALAATLAVLRVPRDVTTRAHYQLRPARLAHALADFAHQPHNGAWRVVSDSSNYTAWRYAVAYECGARCYGRATVHSRDEHGAALSHAAPRAHRVVVLTERCTRLPLLPWPELCDWVETEAEVSSDGAEGALVVEHARCSCAVLSALSGACANNLREQRDAYLLHLRTVLAD